MAETKVSLQSILEPASPINPNTDSHSIERGPRYDAYSQLRESKLRSKRFKLEDDQQESDVIKSETTPIKKSVRFQGSFPGSGKKQVSSVLTQSVPDFSSAVRKENRKPPSEGNFNRLPRVPTSATPPLPTSKREKIYGSKSVNSGEKQSSGRLMMMMTGRKSYASIEELKGLSIAASNAINGEENRGGKRGNLLRKSTILTTRYY